MDRDMQFIQSNFPSLIELWREWNQPRSTQKVLELAIRIRLEQEKVNDNVTQFLLAPDDLDYDRMSSQLQIYHIESAEFSESTLEKILSPLLFLPWMDHPLWFDGHQTIYFPEGHRPPESVDLLPDAFMGYGRTFCFDNLSASVAYFTQTVPLANLIFQIKPTKHVIGDAVKLAIAARAACDWMYVVSQEESTDFPIFTCQLCGGELVWKAMIKKNRDQYFYFEMRRFRNLGSVQTLRDVSQFNRAIISWARDQIRHG
eukprot:TRINITY_DN21364_c0_g1_i1.p1 TRINITY_DN21364_c0_g1~~TRINITY_DN21364_c0_g1_i1.p1  ORF type:complete len:258 (+),score=70.81 TRINITY_DN21364_c0_g1_i1:297-1070(+)